MASPACTIAVTARNARRRRCPRVTKATADRLKLTKISDLTANAGDLVFGGPPECPQRPFCAVGLKDKYGIEPAAGGAVIDTAGFVGSTLNMLDGDFLAGKLKFQGGEGAGSIVNQGWIKAGQGGNIVLVAPNIENSGIIQTEGGEIVLAAGHKMTIGSMELEGVQFEIQAPEDSVLNVGKLLADGVRWAGIGVTFPPAGGQ